MRYTIIRLGANPGLCVVCRKRTDQVLLENENDGWNVCHKDCVPGGYRVIKRDRSSGPQTSLKFNRSSFTLSPGHAAQA
jgi:hypothetical protein